MFFTYDIGVENTRCRFQRIDRGIEQAFMNVGTIDDAIAKGKKLLAEVGA